MATQPQPAPNTAAPALGGAPNSFASGSLYVGDLAYDVTEALLFEIFNQVGPVSSIRVCRDATTKASLGYAYVNFHSVVDAERALDTLNFTQIKSRPCRIMWSHRDPSIRRSNVGNIFIKNLDKGIDNKSLYDTFSTFGNILSCKVAMDGNTSKGYGFVHFETEKGANLAIERVNGMLLNGKQVYVGRFERRADRTAAGGSQYTNVYVKNIPEEWDKTKFESTFERFGKITSSHLQVDEETKKHRGFGFVNYENHEEASRAVEEGSKIAVGADSHLFVDRFQKKSERSAMLAKKYQEIRREKTEKFKNLNLYVKNLEDDVDDAKLQEMFTPYGDITSAVIMRDEKGVSRCFGFVCFGNSDDATKALNDMNGKMVGSKPLYVNRAQRKDERRMQLETQFQANMQPMQPVYYAPPGSMMHQPGLMYPQAMMGGRRYPAQTAAGHMRAAYPVYPGPMNKRGGRAQGGQPRAGMPTQTRPGTQKFRNPNPNARYPRDGQPGPVPVPSVAAPVMAPQMQVMTGQELNAQTLASAPPDVQKQMLGENLFPKVQKIQPNLAGKITGMLLEMETSEILMLVESEQELHQKVREAVEVLHSHSDEPN